MKIGLDYGHGLYQPENAKRYTFTSGPLQGETVIEGQMNRDLAEAFIFLALVTPGVEVYDLVAQQRVLRSDHILNPWDVPLRDRVAYANSLGLDLVLSLHHNAYGKDIEGPGTDARGFTVFTSPGQTRSDDYATAIWEAVAQRFNGSKAQQLRADNSDRDPDREARFYMLVKTTAPAVLVETAFFTNADDVLLAESPRYRKAIVRAMLQGILKESGR